MSFCHKTSILLSFLYPMKIGKKWPLGVQFKKGAWTLQFNILHRFFYTKKKEGFNGFSFSLTAKRFPGLLYP